MVFMFFAVVILTTTLATALVVAEVVDRRRSLEVDSDPTRFAAAPLHPRLPWAITPTGTPVPPR